MQRHLFKVLVCASVAGGAAGCAPILPPAVMIASQAIDGISYITTGKSGTDHILSAALEEDCAVHRIVTGGAVCQALPPEDIATASLSNDPALAGGDPDEGKAAEEDALFAEEPEARLTTAVNDSSSEPHPPGDSALPETPAPVPGPDDLGDENLARVPAPDAAANPDAAAEPVPADLRPGDDDSAGLPLFPPTAFFAA